MEALVSVVVAAYGPPVYLKRAVASAVAQQYRNLQIIVSDDAGPCDTLYVAKSFGDPRILYRREEVRRGSAGNHLGAFREARGKYVAVLNHDDMWNDDFLVKLVPILEADRELAIAFSDHWLIDENDRLLTEATEQNTRYWGRDRLQPGLHRPFWRLAIGEHRSLPMAQAAVLRVDAVRWEDFVVEAGSAWDLYLAYLACRTGRGAFYVPERLTRYRVHPMQETGVEKVGTAAGAAWCYERFLEDRALEELRPVFVKRLCEAQTSLGIALLREGRQPEARPCLWRSLGNRPSLRSFGALLLTFAPPALCKAAFRVHRRAVHSEPTLGGERKPL